MQMDSFNFYSIKAEKANALMPRLQKIANLCRVIEVCVVLVLISRLSMQLPLAVNNSTEYFRDVKLVLVSPRFVFFVGNVIIITLFAKSGQFSARDSTIKTSGFDLYEEFIKNSEKINRKVHPDETPKLDEHSDISNESAVTNYRTVLESYSQYSNGGTLCEKTSRDQGQEKEKCMENTARCCERLAKSSCPEDEMSCEEFQQKVEAFIACWHQRLRREEEYSVTML
ncbi:hypothetical protein F2P56_029340 [Juglans regia]|uniref:Uncharacterized protein LOC108981080 n=2 Tax=Juglans regia TaxID=51240 RepID=A0A2I4DKL6_JUGRE|nr:uncharacterized protein LOC108981080 [Juglans regia]KAF5448841.1 hypothetical protein F2P56_029340 [Juglans regia]